MSQITRCPSCGTQFKVVADQLRISDGWVRCGQCQEVFDAAASLQLSSAASEAAGDAAQDAPAGYELPAAVAADGEDDSELFVDTEPAPASLAAKWPEHETAREVAPALDQAEPEVESARVSEAEPEVEPALISEAEKDKLPLAAAPLTAEPSFVRTARRKAFWQQPGVRVVLGLGCVGLLLALAAQVALQQRNSLAVWQPLLRPALQSLCALTGCSLAARQDITQLVIASSGFARTADAGRYQLSLTIENQASTELAMPAVELTLTDLQDRPVLRRVLLPAEMHAPATLAAQAEWSGSIALAIDAADTRIAGYRALVFYP